MAKCIGAHVYAFSISGSKIQSSSHDLFCPLRLFSYLLDKGVEPKQRQVTWIMYVSCLIPAASVGTLVGDIGGGIGETVSSRESMLVMPCKFTDPYLSPILLPSNGSSNPSVLYQKSKCSTVPFLDIPFGALPKQLHNNASSICTGWFDLMVYSKTTRNGNWQNGSSRLKLW